MAARDRDSFRGRVDADTAQYFAEIASLVGPDGTASDPEERAIIATNAMEEAQGKEVRLACDTSTSHVLEGLLSMLSAEDLIGFLQRSAHGIATLALNPSGSHVADAALRATSAYLALISDATPSWLPSLEAALSSICGVVADQASDIMCSRYGTHVFRNLLALLSGVELGSADGGGRKRGNLAAKLGGSAQGQKGEKHRGLNFPALLASLAEAIMNAVRLHVTVLRVDPSAGPVLQALLVAAEGDHATVKNMIATLLLCPDDADRKDKRILAGAPVDDVVNLMKERSGSHLVEVMLRVAPDDVYKELLKRFFRGRLLELSQHPTANFVVQSLIAHARSGAQVASIVEELEGSVGTLIKQRRAGVVAALLAAANRFEACQKELCKSVAHAVGPKGGGETSLAWGLMMMDQAPTAHPMARMSTLGCAMLQTILGFPVECCQQFAESMATLQDSQVLRAAKDGGGSRAVEAFLTGTAGFKLKNRLLARIKGHFAELAMVAQSSFTVEKCFNVADFKMKEKIASELAAAETEILRTAHGPIILQKCCVTDYMRNPEGWRHRMVTKQDTRKAFEEIFGNEEKQRGGNRHAEAGGHEGNTVGLEEEEEMDDLEEAKGKSKGKDANGGQPRKGSKVLSAAAGESDSDEEADGSMLKSKKKKKTKKLQVVSEAMADNEQEPEVEVRRKRKKEGRKSAGHLLSGGSMEDNMEAIASELFLTKPQNGSTTQASEKMHKRQLASNVLKTEEERPQKKKKKAKQK